MKNILVLILVFVGFMSCDGRKSKSVALKESIEEFKDSIVNIEVIKYFPETYAENVTDSILSKGFRVKIKTYTDMQNSYLNEFEHDSILNKHFYRNYIAEVTISRHQHEIFKKSIDNNFFVKNDKTLVDVFEDMTMHGVWIDQSKSIDFENVVINFLFCKPETDSCFYFEMTIDGQGQHQIKEIKENS